MAFPLKLTLASLAASGLGLWTDWMVGIAAFTAIACLLTVRQLRVEVRDLRASVEDAVD